MKTRSSEKKLVREKSRKSLAKYSRREVTFEFPIETFEEYAAFIVDSDGRIVSWNAGVGNLLGFDRHEFIGMGLASIIAAGEGHSKLDDLLKSEDSVDKWVWEGWCLQKGGRKIWASVTVTPVPKEVSPQNDFSVLIHDLTSRKTVEDQLIEHELQLRSLALSLQTAREEERSKIARELHDEFGQMLTALRMDLAVLERMVSKTVNEALSRMTLVEKISTISGLLENTIRSARRIITELRPAVLDELGLLTAIQWQALEFESRTGIRCRITRLQRDIELDKNASTATFRIFQEALTNVAKHASARNVTVSLQVVGDELVLEISDDGKGMDEDKMRDPTSTGILGIRERVLALRGHFNIVSQPGEGTKLTVSIPYGKTQ